MEKAREETVPQKKKTIAFKSTPTISDDEEEDDDEDLSLLVKNVRRMYNKENFKIEGNDKERKKRKSFVSTVENLDISLPNVRK